MLLPIIKINTAIFELNYILFNVDDELTAVVVFDLNANRYTRLNNV